MCIEQRINNIAEKESDMQINLEHKEKDADKVLNNSVSDMGNGQQKESKSSGEGFTNDYRFMKMVEVTGNTYSKALRKLAKGEQGGHWAYDCRI